MNSARRYLLAILALAASCVVSPGAVLAAERAAGKPNFVLIVADDLTWLDVGCYGGKNARTPNIDRLAGEGMRFTRAYTAAAMCTPCRTMLMTGLFPVKNGAHPNHSTARPGTRSIVHYLHDLGCQVVVKGKTDVRPPDSFAFDQGSLDKLLQAGEPFCYIFGSARPHPPWKAGSDGRFDPRRITLPPYALDTPETREALCRYYADVERLEGEVGQLLDTLRKSGKEQNTLVVFLSEHGSQLPAGKWTCYEPGIHAAVVARWPGVIKPGSVCDEIVQYVDVVPTLIDAAGGQVPGDLDGKSFLDLLQGGREGRWAYAYAVQTTRGIGGATPGGYAVRAVLDKKFKLILNLQHESTFTDNVTEADPEGFWKSWLAAARSGDARARKLVDRYQHRPPVELYDLENDPWEMTNLAGDPAHAPVVARLRERLESWMREQGDHGAATETATENEKGSSEPGP